MKKFCETSSPFYPGKTVPTLIALIHDDMYNLVLIAVACLANP